jgi:hypothetical protein
VASSLERSRSFGCFAAPTLRLDKAGPLRSARSGRQPPTSAARMSVEQEKQKSIELRC